MQCSVVSDFMVAISVTLSPGVRALHGCVPLSASTEFAPPGECGEKSEPVLENREASGETESTHDVTSALLIVLLMLLGVNGESRGESADELEGAARPRTTMIISLSSLTDTRSKLPIRQYPKYKFNFFRKNVFQNLIHFI